VHHNPWDHSGGVEASPGEQQDAGVPNSGAGDHNRGPHGEPGGDRDENEPAKEGRHSDQLQAGVDRGGGGAAETGPQGFCQDGPPE
jgi:hypothetical protein